jgi:Domain of unknown function (DUF2804), C-terminal
MPDPVSPYRGTFGDPRPDELAALALPPKAMPARYGLRPLKAWRYVGVYGPELMLCAGAVRIGRARQAFWAVWDRERARLYERTTLGLGRVRLEPGRASVLEPDVQFDIGLEETTGVETVCPTPNGSYGWTRKQADIPAHGTIALEGRPRTFEARAVIDDTAAYYDRHTTWRWSAGLGTAVDGRALAWNLVTGVNDPPAGSERTLWVDGEPHELGPCAFADDLSSVDHLTFTPEAVRESNDNMLLVRSRYRQPFGTFSGALPGGIELAEGYGVMEDHDVWW